ncbi:MAG TPA: hypothetical protein VFQ53_15855 [Kofleriaceae bacterium]|nr:hypothetical protein [Kofleriaceae bacterium]
MKLALVLGALALAACNADLDPPWQLDHTRIVAVRATPPAIMPGETATIDGLVSREGGPVEELAPESVLVVSPQSMAGAVSRQGDTWVVQAPDAAAIASARGELKLADDAPVPLQLGIAYDGQTLLGLKSVMLGMTAQNPTLATPEVNGAPAADGAELVVGKLVDVPMSITAADTDEVNWLTSCGTMHDFDLPSAYLRVEDEDPTEGQLVVVLRDELGGVGWKIFSIRAE